MGGGGYNWFCHTHLAQLLHDHPLVGLKVLAYVAEVCNNNDNN